MAAQCHYCQGYFPAKQMSRDHVVPKWYGGTLDRWNVVAACVPCNSLKGPHFWPSHCQFCRRAWRKFLKRQGRIRHRVPPEVRTIVRSL